MVEGEVFEFGLVKSKHSVLLKDFDKRFYFVSDAWTTTRYPRTPEGLKSAKAHILYNQNIDKKINR